MPDAGLVERILAALDDGVPADPAALARVVTAAEAEVREVLAALAQYRQRVEDGRDAAAADDAGDGCGDLEPGTRLGDFVVEDVLGSGAMGVVYRARQASLDRPVALKVLPPELVLKDVRFVERFRREATLAATIRHPNIAEVYGFVETDGWLGFAMRLVDGPTLHGVLTRLAAEQVAPVRPTSAAHVRRCVLLVRTLADALAVIHAQGLVHRDVKPANVLLEGGGERALHGAPVLVDFGLLRPTGASALTGTHTLLGTPAYAAHESVLGQDVDARADVFSLGATLYDLLTVTSPGTRGPATAGLADVRSINPQIDARLAAIVAKALAADRALRYEHGGALRDELDRYLRGEPIRALPATAWGRFVAWVRRDPRRAARVGVLTTISAIVVLAGLFSAVAWALRVHGIAVAAAQLEKDGDLAGAAGAYRNLLGIPYANVLWWLADDREQAARYWRAGRPMRQACELLLGADALTYESAAGTELRFDRIADRLCQVLFDPECALLHDAVRTFLLREVESGGADQRRRPALDAWTNYLILQPDPQPVPPRLHGLLHRLLFDGEGLDPDNRAAATAALGAIRTLGAFADLVELMHRDEPREVLRLAERGAQQLFRLRHARDADACRAIEPELMLRWVRGVERLVSAGLADPRTVAPCLAAWERVRTERLELTADFRAAIAAVETATGALQPDTFESKIWVRDPGEDEDRPLAERRAVAPSAVSTGRLELVRGERRADGRPAAELHGTVFEAVCRSGELLDWEGNSPDAYLWLYRPGHSLLRVRSVVPAGATHLVVRVRHMPGTRGVVRDQGTIVYRMQVHPSRGGRVSHRPWEQTAVVPNPVLGGAARCVTEVAIGRDAFDGCDEIAFVLEYLRGNTTYRVMDVQFEWTVR